MRRLLVGATVGAYLSVGAAVFAVARRAVRRLPDAEKPSRWAILGRCLAWPVAVVGALSDLRGKNRALTHRVRSASIVENTSAEGGERQ